MNEGKVVTKESVLVGADVTEGYFSRRVSERFHLATSEQGSKILVDLFEEIRAWLRGHGNRRQFLTDNDGHVAFILRGADIIFETHGKMPEPVFPPLPS